MAASFSLLCSVFSLQNCWWLPKKRVYAETLVSQVNKNNDLDFGPYLMGFPHGLRKTNPTRATPLRFGKAPSKVTDPVFRHPGVAHSQEPYS